MKSVCESWQSCDSNQRETFQAAICLFVLVGEIVLITSWVHQAQVGWIDRHSLQVLTPLEVQMLEPRETRLSLISYLHYSLLFRNVGNTLEYGSFVNE